MHTNTILNLISQISKDEEILWAGAPHKDALILESIFNKMLIPAGIWTFMDYAFFISVIESNPHRLILTTTVILLIIHMLPVLIYIAGTIITGLSYQNTCYVITNKAIYISTGVFKTIFESRPHTEIKKVRIKKGLFDRIYNIGDINVTYKTKGLYKLTRNGIPIHNILEYNKVFDLVLDLKTKAKYELKQQRQEARKLKKENK